MLTTEAINATANDAELTDMLGNEIKRLIPEETFNDDEQFYSAVDELPRRLKAMQGV